MNTIQEIKDLIQEASQEKIIVKNGLNYRTTCKVFCIDKNNNILCEVNAPPKEPELPGGALDINETHIQTAKRELMEEAGWTAKNFVFIQHRKIFHLENNTAQEWFGRDGWSGEMYSAVKCEPIEYKPDATFGIEGDQGNFELIPIKRFKELLKLARPKYDRVKFRNQFYFEVLKLLGY